MPSYTFAHIINPVGHDENPDLAQLQEVTFRSMANAKHFTGTTHSVEQYATFLKGRSATLPDTIKRLSDLPRSTTDVIKGSTKAYPFLTDILAALNRQSSADYFIYTNLDICLMPSFYNSVALLIDAGHDALVINRRRISKNYLHKDIQLMYADVGLVHPGYDAFVFKRALLEKFVLNDISIGVPPTGNDLFYNLMCFAERPKLFTQLHLTFHIGIDLVKNWGEPVIFEHNSREFKKLLSAIYPKLSITKFPGAEMNPFRRHFKWLMNPTLHYPTMLKLDLKEFKWKRSPTQPEIPGMAHRFYESMVNRINFD